MFSATTPSLLETSSVKFFGLRLGTIMVETCESHVSTLDGWEIHGGAGGVQAKFVAASQLAAANTIQKSVEKLILSNEKIATSNKAHATAIKWLTGTLVFVGVIQIIVQLLPNT